MHSERKAARVHFSQVTPPTQLGTISTMSPPDSVFSRAIQKADVAGPKPPWTSLFGVATAVVTDTGGILSHCAMVAREYGMPAVVGTGPATQLFRDGQLLEVNGTAGTVRVLAEMGGEV